MLLVHSRELIFKGETMPVCVKQLKKSFYEGKRKVFAGSGFSLPKRWFVSADRGVQAKLRPCQPTELGLLPRPGPEFATWWSWGSCPGQAQALLAG